MRNKLGAFFFCILFENTINYQSALFKKINPSQILCLSDKNILLMFIVKSFSVAKDLNKEDSQVSDHHRRKVKKNLVQIKNILPKNNSRHRIA